MMLFRLYEVMSLFRKKLAASTPRTVVLTLRLLEALVNNCGTKWHQLMNDPKICNDITHVARKYIRRPGSDNREVADVALDLVQGWGEAFLPKRKQYPNIVETYFTLRKEGLPFKTNQQFDPNRMQIFGSPAPSTGAAYNRDNTDAILAATLQSQLELEREQEIAAQQQAAYQSYGAGAGRGAPAPSSYPPRGPPQAQHQQQRSSPPTHGYGHQGEVAQRDQYNPTATQVVEALSTSIMLLRDMILASTQLDEIKYNEFADEIVDQMKESLRRVDAAIETAMTDEKLLERLFELNDQSQLVLQVYNDVKDGKIGLIQGQKALQKNAGGAVSPAAGPALGHTPGHHQQNSDLIDYNALIAEAEEAERQRQYAQQQHYQHQQQQFHPQQQQAYYSSPRNSPSQQARKQHPPQQQQQHQPRRIAPPPNAHAPTRQDSTGGDLVVAAKDPFAPDALDALFGSNPPPRAPPSSPPKANKQHATAGVNRQESNDAGDVIVAAKDPFAPDALDALFDNKPKAAVAPAAATGPKYDPFAPAALDALFDGPPNNQQQRSRQVSKDESQQPRASPGKPNPATGQRNPFSPEALDALFDTPKQPPVQYNQQAPQAYYGQQPPPAGYSQAGYYGQAPPPVYYPGYPPQGLLVLN